MPRLAVCGALVHLANSQSGPSCNQVDGDYPGCGISKMTHASSQPREGKKWMEKYFNVQAPGDECTDDQCDCSATSGVPAWHIDQGRVFTTRQISPGAGMSPGNGFGLHLVSVPEHKTTGGLTVEEVEDHFKSKLDGMSKFDSFMDFNVVFATSSLSAYKNAFDADGVKYVQGSWSDSAKQEYTSIIVQVPGSQLLFELVQPGTMEGSSVKFEQRIPDATLQARKNDIFTREPVTDTRSDYIVSLAVNRAASAKSMAKLDDFYVTGMGTTKTLDSSSDGISKKCFLWPGATVDICFTNRADTETSSSFKVGDFEDMLNNVHETVIGGHPNCPMDRWFDNHYAIDSRTVDNTKILNYVNSNGVYHTCSSNPMGGSGTHAIFDPTGLGIQMDTGLGLAADCSSSTFELHECEGCVQGKFNPACTVDTSQCGSLTNLTFVA